MSASTPNVRIGVIGIGNMGTIHVESLLAHKIKRAEVTAICDIEPKALAKFPQLKSFSDSKDMIRSGLVDAVILSMPHYGHTPIGIDALSSGLNVLCEKPLAVHKADCERMIAAYQKRPDPRKKFAIMFNQRTDPRYIKVKRMIEAGELGEIRRINWIITDWFRTQTYYASGGWRATWKGEGGGVLINQCPHNLDLMQWMFGLPSKVRAFCKFGRWHHIETEDQVTAYLEYPNGATGIFVTTTGESPGTNRLEIAAERGRVVIEGGKITFTRNLEPMTEFSHTTKELWGRPETWHIDIPVHGYGGQHNEVLQNFVDAVLDDTPLIAQAEEGLRSVELGNSMILSTLLDKTVDLPIDPAVYEQQLKKLVADSKFEKTVDDQGSKGDFAKSQSR
jgi:predicted dehydrogenase